jgi:hypothetical protein
MTDATPSAPPPIPDRLDRLEVDMLDVKIALNQLIDHTFQSQQIMTQSIERLAQAQERTLQFVETMQAEMRVMQTEIRDIQLEVRDIQLEVRGIQTENRRIIQRVFGEEAGED